MLRATLQYFCNKKRPPSVFLDRGLFFCYSRYSPHIAVFSPVCSQVSISPSVPTETVRGDVTASCGAFCTSQYHISSFACMIPAISSARAANMSGTPVTITPISAAQQMIVSRSSILSPPLFHADSLPHGDDVRVLDAVDLRQLLVCSAILPGNRRKSVPGFHGIINRRAGR